MRPKSLILNTVSAVCLLASSGITAQSQEARAQMDEKQEIEIVIAAIRSVVPEGLLGVEVNWLCRPSSMDPKCHVSGGLLNERYKVGNFKWGRLFALMQLATGSVQVERVGLDRPRVQVERPWLRGDSVILAVKVRPGRQPAPGDTLTTFHEVVLGVVEGKISTRSVKALFDK